MLLKNYSLLDRRGFLTLNTVEQQGTLIHAHQFSRKDFSLTFMLCGKLNQKSKIPNINMCTSLHLFFFKKNASCTSYTKRKTKYINTKKENLRITKRQPLSKFSTCTY